MEHDRISCRLSTSEHQANFKGLGGFSNLSMEVLTAEESSVGRLVLIYPAKKS